MNKDILLRHTNATVDDLAGNGGIGRYILLPGSDGRAKEISQHFNNLVIKSHPRGHNLYLGTITHGEKNIDVAAISSGMGCPSMEIILHELFHLGGKRFLRIGTAGSLQPDFVKIGDIVNAQASVRDEHTTLDYVPIGMPAISSMEFNSAFELAANKLGLSEKTHSGIVHCKSSLYAREFGVGPQAEINHSYIRLLTQCGVLASEMETAALFIQSQLYNYQLMQKGKGEEHRVLCGAVLGVVSILTDEFASSEEENMLVRNLIELALDMIRTI